MQRTSVRLWKLPFVSCRTTRFSLQSPLSLLTRRAIVFGNKLSLNLLQDRLACASQLSLKGVIATNLMVNSWLKLAQFQFVPRLWHEIAFSPSPLVSLLNSDLGLLLASLS